MNNPTPKRLECKPFEHKLSYVTDREDMVQCNKCFIQWKLFDDDVRFKSLSMGFDELYKLRKKYL